MILRLNITGNVYISGFDSDNAFKITAAGVITEIIDETGDGLGSNLEASIGIAVDGDGNVYVTGDGSDNVFKVTPTGVIIEIINATGTALGKQSDWSCRYCNRQRGQCLCRWE